MLEKFRKKKQERKFIKNCYDVYQDQGLDIEKDTTSGTYTSTQTKENIEQIMKSNILENDRELTREDYARVYNMDGNPRKRKQRNTYHNIFDDTDDDRTPRDLVHPDEYFNNYWKIGRHFDQTEYFDLW